MAERGHLPAQTGLKSLLYTASAGVLLFQIKGSEEKSTQPSAAQRTLVLVEEGARPLRKMASEPRTECESTRLRRGRPS